MGRALRPGHGHVRQREGGVGLSTSRWHPARLGLRPGLSQAAPHGPGHASRIMLHVLSFGVSVPRPEL